MAWTVSQLNVDFNHSRVTLQMDSNATPNTSVSLSFSMGDNNGPADDVTRKAVLAQTKRILMDAANTL